MSCRDWQEKIALSLYGELEAVESRDLEAHVAVCPACREAREALSGTVALLRRDSLPLPGSVRPPARPTRLRWFAAAAAALAAAVVLAVGIGNDPEPNRPEPLVHVLKNKPPLPVNQRVLEALAAGSAEALQSLTPLSLEAEDALIAAAGGTDPVLAVQAIEWLGIAGSRRSKAVLRTAFAARVTRPAAFRALRARGELDLAADVVPALADPGLRREATEILATRRTEKTFSLLMAAVASGNAAASAACRSFPADVALPALMAALDDPALRGAATELLLTTDGDDVRGALVLRCLGDDALCHDALASAIADPADPRRARFIALALSSPSLAGKASAAVASIPVRKLKSAIETALRDPANRPPLVAFLSARADDAAARDLLVAALDGPEARPEAARALLERGDLRPVRVLLENADVAALEALPVSVRRRELERGLRTAKLRKGALLAITAEDAALWPDIVPLLRDESLRATAAAALARAGADRAIPYLIPFVSPSGDGPRVRDALVSLAGVDAGEKSQQWSRWWSTRRRD